MRLCTHCISCTNCLPLPKRALLPAEPPPNRPQIPERTTVLPRTIRADGQEENKGKRTSQKHPNSFPSSGKGRVAVFDGPAILAMYSPLRSHTRFCDQPQTTFSSCSGSFVGAALSNPTTYFVFRTPFIINCAGATHEAASEIRRPVLPATT